MLKVQEIRELIKLVDQSTIDEFSYETNGTTVTMKKSNDNQGVKLNEAYEVPAEKPAEKIKAEEPKAPEEKKAVKQSETEPVEKEKATDFDHEIVSPMVGTLYIGPDPESDPYVKSGSKVENDSVVCIVEAMKLFNEIEAEVSGEIVEILVEDGELVEYGQPLFRVKTK
ncbi:acetyl-CoA carboxylase biotin carboxyl carrier protein [Virgibacillus litoralis]|uniref:Biotin carboxyl carrier protein of acetyl-CoA carboxylase n=1 Tax=Virgibacillus litoralis TaxID=578221 RepID=A0ABS4HHM9_9BACI|nr:acetyl-CoA carboxylase biotin carboxyl carrier protein [Virgibacillus litoralis]MBP1950388.1 acetyl-CoA carboxylase biotin carboxyl carrier protein [Virgibacillus litoralis]